MNCGRFLCDPNEYCQHSLQFDWEWIPIFVTKPDIKRIELLRDNFAQCTKRKHGNVCPKHHEQIENKVLRIWHTFRLRKCVKGCDYWTVWIKNSHVESSICRIPIANEPPEVNCKCLNETKRCVQWWKLHGFHWMCPSTYEKWRRFDCIHRSNNSPMTQLFCIQIKSNDVVEVNRQISNISFLAIQLFQIALNVLDDAVKKPTWPD